VIDEIPDPDVGEGEVLVDVKAIGVNFRDVYERSAAGYGAPPPSVPGIEGAGVVVDTGERVAWIHVPRSYAERIVAPAEKLVPLPDDVSFETAAAVLHQGMTAHYLAFDSYPVQEGEWVLVHAAAGGVGLLLTQLVKLRGGHVIGTTSSEAKAAAARAVGADDVIGYDGFAERAREITGGEGVAAVYDGVGKATFSDGLGAIRPTGCMVLYGLASGNVEPLNPRDLGVAGSLYLQRPALPTYTRTTELLHERAAAVLDLVARGQLAPQICTRYPLEDARQAHEDLESRATTGKLVLVP
jgi:NADPH2:quinone reductase